MKTSQVVTTHKTIRIVPLFAAAALCIIAPQLKAAPTAAKPATAAKKLPEPNIETLGGGTVATKAVGPAPSYGAGEELEVWD